MSDGREGLEGNSEEIGKYHAILEKDPRSRVFAPLAEAYRKAGRLDDAIDTARDGLANHPSYLSGRVALARALFEKGEPGEAQNEISQVVQAAPDNLMAHKLLGQIHLQSGNADEAQKSFNMVLLLDPRDQEAQAALENLKTPPAHTPPPVEEEAPGAGPEPDVLPEEIEIPAGGAEGAPAEEDTPPEGLVFEGEEEDSPFDQSFDDVVEPTVPAEAAGGDAGPAAVPAEPEAEPFDLTVEDQSEAEEVVADAATEADSAVDEIPFDLGADEDFDSDPTARDIVGDDSALDDSGDVPFDLEADGEPEPEPDGGAAEEDGSAVEAGQPFEGEDGPAEAPVDEEPEPGWDDAGASAVEELTRGADDVPFDLEVDGDLMEGGDFVDAPQDGEETPAAFDETAFGLPGGDLEPAAAEAPLREESPAVPEAPAQALPEAGGSEGDAFNTETLAHLYIKQGFYDKAAAVYEAMLQEKPDDLSLRQKREEARSLASMMVQAESPAAAVTETAAPRPPVPESPADTAPEGEHPAIVGLRRFLEQLKERQR